MGLSEDEIIRDWSLHTEDLVFVKKFRKQYQLWAYLQVCSLKLLGQLLDNPNTLDTRIIGHACKSLTLDIIGTVGVPDRDATRTDYKKSIFSHLDFKQLPELLISEIDQTLEVISGEGITWFQKFKEYPGASTISLLQDYLQRYHRIESIDLSDVDISYVPPELVQHLYQLMKYYDAFRVRRFKPQKRYSLMLLFLNESKKLIMDYLIQLRD